MFVRFAVPRTLAALVFTGALMAAPAAAQDAAPAPTLRDAANAAAAEFAELAVQPPAPLASPSQQDRPAALMPLYASFIALQGLDVHSTTRGLSRGAVEANPFMKDVAGNPGALIAVKAASTAGIIFGVEKLRRKNRAAAVAVMLALNAGTAYVVQHNYRVAGY
jgi:hypothetical protein